MPQSYFDDQGREVILGKEIGTGGEGSLFEIVGLADCVAKLYSEAPDTELEQKLRVMIGMSNPQLHQFCAWPQQLVRSGVPNGPVAGFVMRYFRDAVQLRDLLIPSDRIFHFPHLNWKDLVQLAEHLAKAVAITHSFGLVIGDLHPENIMVSQTAMPLLIDCDSWQIPSPHKVFRRQVLREDFTPPELQGVDFSKIDGTPNHDAFALAIMIFVCLFPGQNPFAGSFTGKGPDDLMTAIKEHRYAYAKDATRRKVEPRSDSLRPAELTTPLADMFEKAFLRDKNRPTASDWQNALREFRRTLVPCAVNKRHFHQSKQRKCRLCEFESAFLRLTFPDIVAQAVADSNAAWTLPPTGQQLSQKLMPAVSFPIAAGAKTVRTLSSSIEQSINIEVRLTQCFLLGFAFSVTCLLLDLIPQIPAVLTSILLVVLAGYVLVSPAHRERKQRRRAARSAEYQAHKEEKALQKLIKTAAVHIPDLNRVTSVRQDLEKSYLTYHAYHQNQRKRFDERAETEFLKQQAISILSIPGLSKTAMTELAQHGIVTAADVRAEKVAKVGTLNDRQRTLILNWRTRINAAYQPPQYKSILTANGFAQEFELYQDRLPREQYINDVVNKVQAGGSQVLTQTQLAIDQIQSLRTQAETDSEQAAIIQKKLWGPFVDPSGYALTMLLFAILCAPACKFAVRQWEQRQSVTVADAAIPPVDPIPIPIENDVPVPREDAAREIRIKPVWPKAVSSTSSHESVLPEPPQLAEPRGATQEFATSKPEPSHGSEESDANTPEIEAEVLAGYRTAYSLYIDKDFFKGYMELFNVIQRTGGTVPPTIYEKLEKAKGPTRSVFETSCRTIEAQFRAQAEAEAEAEAERLKQKKGR